MHIPDVDESRAEFRLNPCRPDRLNRVGGRLPPGFSVVTLKSNKSPARGEPRAGRYCNKDRRNLLLDRVDRHAAAGARDVRPNGWRRQCVSLPVLSAEDNTVPLVPIACGTVRIRGIRR